MSNRGPIEDLDWPRRLLAHVVSTSAPHRLHGFDVAADLARNYTFAETAFIALTGAPPGVEAGRLFEFALVILSPATAAEPPAHVAYLSRVCGTTPTSAIASGTIALAEQVRFRLDQLSGFLEWLADPSGPAPLDVDATSATLCEVIREGLPAGAGGVVRRFDLPPDAAGIALLWELGIQTREQLSAALMFAKFPILGAHVVAAADGKLKEYPIDSPPFRYEPPPSEDSDV